MINITFYLGSNEGSLIDATNIEKGNPGIGGTQYCILLLAHCLNRTGSYKVTIMSKRDVLLEPGIKYLNVIDDSEVVTLAEKINTDILILKHFPNSVLEKDVQKSNLKVIVWSHNFIDASFCKYISRTSQIKCSVFVGKQQYDSYIDDDVINKSVTIYNMVPPLEHNEPRKNDSKTIVFLGAIVPKKGFLEMCKIWPGIVKDVPDAKLIVLGSGKLYGDAPLGKYGIAQESYEKQFLPYITDNDGNLLSSVIFKGLVGEEKYDLFRTASVGVVNPSGCRETFGMAIIEMGLCGLPVATIGTTGYYDTVISNETGCLCTSLPKLQEAIINLLNDSGLNASIGGG